jgi:hypothetical protein
VKLVALSPGHSLHRDRVFEEAIEMVRELLGEGWLASAYNTTPVRFAAATDRLGMELEARGRSLDGFPNALVTMWAWVTEDRSDGDRVLIQVLAPLLNRDSDELGGQVCVGPDETCAELLRATPRRAASASTSGRSERSGARSSCRRPR